VSSGDKTKVGSTVVNLKLYRTSKSDPVVTISATYAREDDAGKLYFEGGEHMVLSYDEGDHARFDRQLAKHHVEAALWFARRNGGKEAEKVAKRLKKVLRLLRG
jgi:hypothetical protein